MKITRCATKNGFTLIEIIITLVIASILGVIIFQYLGSSMVRSSDPIFRLKKSLTLQQVAENITADYKRNFTDLVGLKAKVESPSTSGYGDYTVVTSKYIKFDNFQEIDEPNADIKKMLKVTIKNEQNETLTMLFIVP
ncbi:MAG: type II secretion system protein [Smithellaceae bacterium]|jgi:prepilin-type N-terminal cleavage/methylation domain-containing protein